MRLINSAKNPLIEKCLTSFVVFFLTISIVCAGFPRVAHAGVQKADVVLGQTVDTRGLSVAQCPNIDAEYAAVMSADGTLYFERNATVATPIASITKIMTALVALETASGDTAITVSSAAAAIGESSASLQAGDVLDFTSALKGLMVPSGNDAAVAIAETIGKQLSGGSAQGSAAEEVFVNRMNEKASELGLVNTLFSNPHGLDDGVYKGNQHSCAYDVARIAQAAMQNEAFRTVVSMPEASITVTHADGTKGTLILSSTDQLLDTYEGACGIKTGFTDAAGACFAGACERGGQYLYAIVLKSSDEAARFTDTEALFDWVYEHTVSYTLAHSEEDTLMTKGGQSSTVPLVARVAHDDWIDKTVTATLADPTQAISLFDLNGNVSQVVEYTSLNGTIRVGDKVGTLTFKQRNEVLITVDIVACEEVKAPDLFEGIGIWWDRFFRNFTNAPTVADSTLLNTTPLVSIKSDVR